LLLFPVFLPCMALQENVFDCCERLIVSVAVFSPAHHLVLILLSYFAVSCSLGDFNFMALFLLSSKVDCHVVVAAMFCHQRLFLFLAVIVHLETNLRD